jgi:hypothetical protein
MLAGATCGPQVRSKGTAWGDHHVVWLQARARGSRGDTMAMECRR